MEPNLPALLIGFIADLVGEQGDSWNSAISPERALIEAQQYPYLRYVLGVNQEKIVAARLQGEEALQQVVAEIFRQAHRDLITHLPGLQKQEKDSPLAPREIAQRAVYWQRANEKQKEFLAPQLEEVAQKRQAFPRTLVRQWVQRLRDQRLLPHAETIAASVERALAQIDPQLLSAELEKEVERQAVAVVKRFPESAQALEENPQAFAAAAAETRPLRQEFVEALARYQGVARTLARAVINHPEIIRKDNLVELVWGGLSVPGASPSAVETRAVKLTRVAQVLGSPLPPEEDITASGKLWQSLATNWYQKALAPLADSLFVRFPPKLRSMVVDNVLMRSWEPTLTALQTRFGTNILSSPLFKNILSHQRVLEQRASAAAVSGISKVAGEVFAAVFRGPNEAMIAYYEASLASRGRLFGETPLTTGQIIAAGVYQKFPGLFRFEFLPKLGEVILRLGKQKAGEAVAGAAAQAAARRGLAAIAAKLGLSALAGALSGGTSFLVQAGLWLGTKALGLVSAAAGWIFSGGWLTSLMGMGTGPRDRSWIAPLIIVATLVLLFVFPSVLNFQHTGEISRSSPLPLSAVGGLVPGGLAVDCAKKPDDPLCKFEPCKGDCRWPTSGYITQGPYAACSSASHRGLNAIDIAASYLTMVYATAPGVISRVYAGCADGTGYIGNRCGNGYGNHVVLTTDSGYQLIYGHLSQNFLDTLKSGDKINPGDPLGKIDHNGSSTSNHLHFGVLGASPNINAVIPPDFGPIAGCASGAAGCNYCNYPAVRAGK